MKDHPLVKGLIFTLMWGGIIFAIVSSAKDCKSDAEIQKYKDGWR